MDGGDKDNEPDNAPQALTDAASTRKSTTTKSTPFVYPIRSLLSTVQAQSPNLNELVDPQNGRAYRGRRVDEDTTIYSLSATAPLPNGASVSAPPGPSSSSSGEQVKRGASLTFPSNSRLGKLLGDGKPFIPLPPIRRPHSGEGADSDTSSAWTLPAPPKEQQHPPFNAPKPERPRRKPPLATAPMPMPEAKDKIKVQDHAEPNSEQKTVRATASQNVQPNGEVSKTVVGEDDEGSGSSQVTSAAITALSGLDPFPEQAHSNAQESPRGSFSDLVRLPPPSDELQVKQGSQPSLPHSHSSHAPNRISNESGVDQDGRDDGGSSSLAVPPPPVTVRFKYTVDENGHHHVVGRDGVLTRCEDEPIRTPGAVQSYGVILVLEEQPIGEEVRLVVRQVSENVHRILGLSVPFLFSLDCFSDVLPLDQSELLWKHLMFLQDPNVIPDVNGQTQGSINEDENDSQYAMKMNQISAKISIEGPEVFMLSGWSEPQSESDYEGRIPWRCWCAAHRPVVPKRKVARPHAAEDTPLSEDASSVVDSAVVSMSDMDMFWEYKRLIILEFELEHDEENRMYSRHQFGEMPVSSSGSRTSPSLSMSGEHSGRSSSGSGGPSTGSSSEQTTTPMLDHQQHGASPVPLPPPARLTNEALRTLPEERGLNLPPPGQVFASPYTREGSEGTPSGVQSTSPVLEEPVYGLEGDDSWFPSINDIQESTTSRSKPIKALEKMRLLARGQGPSVRHSPAVRRLGVLNQGSPASSGAGSSTRERPSSSVPSPPPNGGLRAGGSQDSGRQSRIRPPPPPPPPPPIPSSGSVGTMDVFAVLADVTEQMGQAPDLEAFLKVVVGVIKDMTQFHRVLVYQFDDMWNGLVVAELVDWSASHDLYKGLHFPASDIPPQARELYLINKVRSLYDREQPTSRLVCRELSDLDDPLDMTHCYLRAMSPIHVKYLGNMGVRASMSISITAFGQLWGLIACHSYGLHGMRVSFPVRQMLRLLSDTISRNIERLSYAERLHTRKLISTIPSNHHPTGYIVSDADDLLSLFDAEYGALVVGDGARVLGPPENGREVLAVAQYLRMKQFALLQASASVHKDYSDLIVPSGLDMMCGMLYVPLSPGGHDFIVFLRKGQAKDVFWAGKPHKPGGEAFASLEPRTSFKAWGQTVMGRCRSWTDEQIETAGVLALVYGKFMDVWRQKESAVRQTRLATLLLSNATHEVRTPLNQIIGFLDLALEGNLDEETRANLMTTHKASKSLLFTINDLLDLTRLEAGHTTQSSDCFDLPTLMRETLAPYEKDARRKGLDFELKLENSPHTVIGDSRKIASVVANLTANAVKFTEIGGVTVDCQPFIEPDGLRDSHMTATTKEVAVEIIVSDTGCGIPQSKLEEIFRQFEQVEHDRHEHEQKLQAGLGLGLAVVARIVEQVGGQLRVDSNDAGSKFSFLLPFTLPDYSRRGSSDLIASRPASHSTASEVDDFVTAMSTSHMKGQSPAHSFGRAPPSFSDRPNSMERPKNDGKFFVQDSKIPVRGIRVDEYSLDKDHSPTQKSTPESENPPSTGPTTWKLDNPIRPAGRLRVLLVEDNRLNSMLLMKFLENLGHTAVAVWNGQEAKDLVERDFDFDLVFMDLDMPILNGYEATEAIRAYEAQKNPPRVLETHKLAGRMPVIAVSAKIETPQPAILRDAGLDGYSLKPMDRERLRELIRGTLDLDQRRKDMYKPEHWTTGGWLHWYEGNGPL